MIILFELVVSDSLVFDGIISFRGGFHILNLTVYFTDTESNGGTDSTNRQEGLCTEVKKETRQTYWLDLHV